MVTRNFVNDAARAWRAAACKLQRPDAYDAAAKIAATPDLSQLASQLDAGDRDRG